jgi:hypothetical protein
MPGLIDQLAPEERLLLLLCRHSFSETEKKELSAVAEKVHDWNHFLLLANKHGIIALCRHRLNSMECGRFVPDECMNMLHEAFLKSLSRNSRIYLLLDEVLAIASKENIRVVLLKGLALEKTVYGNMGLRQMTDLDILVKKDEAIKLRKLLLANGFDSMPMYSRLHEKIVPSYGKHLPEMYKYGLSVEIHFRLFEDRDNALTGEFFAKAEPESSLSPAIFIPEQQSHFLYLVKHLSQHESEGYSQLRLYADLAYLLGDSGDGVVNASLFDLAGRAKLEKMLAEKLYILKNYFDLRLPSALLSEPGPWNAGETDRNFIFNITHPAGTPEKAEQEPILKPLKLMEKRSDKLLFIAGALFPSVAFMKYRYRLSSGFIAYLYYPVRLFRFMIRLFR